MNVLMVGVSHHTAPVDLLARLVVPPEEAGTVLQAVAAKRYVDEVVLLSTCNRVEVYAAVGAFHAGLGEIGTVLAERAGVSVAELAPYLSVHYGVDAVRHALLVAAGLDSMVIGETQILGQFRDAYGFAAERGAVGRRLHELMQHALRVGKRVHAETGIDRAGQSIVTAALSLAIAEGGRAESDRVGSDRAGNDRVAGGGGGRGVGGRSALIVGAGSMGALALATLRREGAGTVTVLNRTFDRAHRLAELYGAYAVDFAELPAILSTVDIVVCATASASAVLTVDIVATALADRKADGPLLILDLAVPRDVDPAVGRVPGVVLVDVARVGESGGGEPSSADRSDAVDIVTAEVETFVTWLRGVEVAPTVAALRARADDVVTAELRRLGQRRPDLSDEQRADVAHTLHRVVQRLLHSPTVRVRELAGTPGGDQYAEALRELFDLKVPVPDADVRRAVEIGGVDELSEGERS